MKPSSPLWLTESPKRSCACILSRRWNRCSTPTRTAIDQGDRRYKQWEHAENGVGEQTG